MTAAKKKDFQRKTMEALTLGACLNKLRTEAGFEVSQLAQETKIQEKYIKALEKGLYEQLPSKVYLRGFVESYGKALHVPVERLLKLLDREYDVYENITKENRVESPVARAEYQRSFQLRPRMIATIVAAILVLGGGYYLFTQVRNFVASPWLTVTTPHNGSSVDERTVTFSGETSPSATLVINEQLIALDNAGQFSQEIDLTQGENVFVVRSTNQFGQATTTHVTVHGTFDTVQREIAAPEATSIAMDVRAGATDVWLSIVRDGLTAETLTLPSGQTHHIEALEHVIITSGRGNETFITFNGESLGALGEDENVVRNVRFERTGRVAEEPAYGDSDTDQDVLERDAVTERVESVSDVAESPEGAFDTEDPEERAETTTEDTLNN